MLKCWLWAAAMRCSFHINVFVFLTAPHFCGAFLLSGYEVILVNHYFENDKPVETPEGRRNRQIKEAESNQLTLFDYDNI